MRLNATDRRFVELLAGEEAPFVVVKLEERSALAEAMSPAVLRPLPRRLTDYAKLVARVLQAALTPSPAAATDSVVFERDAALLAGRVGFFEWFSVGERVFPLSRNGRMARQADLGRALRVLAGLLPLVMGASRSALLAPHYVTIARTCLLVSAHTAATRTRTAHVFPAFRIETAFIAAYLRGCGLRSDVVVETTPMAPYNRRLLADTVTLTNPYHVDEARVFAAESRAGSYRLWGPTEAPVMERAYAGGTVDDLPTVVGVYTQGYWMRVKRGSCDPATAAVMLPLEEEFTELVADLARRSPAVQFVVFPHPMERRWFAETGESGPQWSTDLRNVRLASDVPGGSILRFAEVGLGLTTVSTIGFDRLYMGFRTIFYTGASPQLDLSVPSQFSPLFFDEPGAFAVAVERERLRGHAEFMAAHFDPTGYAPWTAAGPGKPRILAGRRYDRG